MELKRSIRISGYGDYVAVDLINELGNIMSTPFYAHVNDPVDVEVMDHEDHVWMKSTVEYVGGDRIKIVCNDGIEYEECARELISEKEFRFIAE